jgi:OmpA family
LRLVLVALACLAVAAGLGTGSAAAAGTVRPVRLSIYFRLGQTSLTSEAEAVLDEVVKTVNQGNTARVIIIGHTDKSGPTKVNRRIAAQRAEVVIQGLIARGLDPAKIAVEPARSGPSSSDDGSFISERRTDVIIVPQSGATGS